METKFSAHPAMFKNHPLGFIVSILLIPVGVGILILLVWYLKCKSTRLEVVGNDIVLERGLLSKDRTELNLSSIRSVNVWQSFTDRIFGVGKITVFSAGDKPEILVSGIPNPHQFREVVKASQPPK